MGMTRAEQKVYISHARSRYRFGEVAYQSRSRFIDEIKTSELEELNGGIGRKANRKTKKELFYEYFNSVNYEDFDQDNKVVHIGSRVMHEKFGLGKVIDVEGVGDQVKATVNFEGNNVRQLMLKFARLKILH
jgi:DNA helicase-2/ATP-dependent DNA helicase PcrA